MAEYAHTRYDLAQMQSLPMKYKVIMSKQRIRDWYDYWGGNVVVSFSGGKDSTVLLHLVRSMYPEVRAVFSNTGLEYPEIQRFVNGYENVDVITPPMRFTEVVSQYGYPIISKEVAEAIYYARRINGGKSTYHHRERAFGNRDLSSSMNKLLNKQKFLPIARDLPIRVSHYCCYVMKKHPMKKYQRRNKVRPFLGTLAEESRIRKQAWIRTGCNAYDGDNPHSMPIAFWTEQDILQYIVENGLEICSVYGEVEAHNGTLICSGCKTTGCIFCGFGLHSENGETRFQRLKRTHPKQYSYCIGGGQWIDNPEYDPAAPRMDGDWQNWNPKQIWVPSKQGLGMGKVFDMVNEIYGKDFYRYE